MILAYAAIFGGVQIICTWLGSVKLFAYLRDRDREQAKERRELYQRIQSPETAVAQAVAEDVTELVAAVPFEDDDAYWKKRGIE